MKKATLLLGILLLTLSSCDLIITRKQNLKSQKKEIDTVYVYFSDDFPKKKTYKENYNNFTETRKVVFRYIKNYETKKVGMIWDLWIDDEIMDSNPISYDEINIDEIDKYEAKIRRKENAKIPMYIKQMNEYKRLEGK